MNVTLFIIAIVKPKLFKFLEKPTRAKALGVWLLFVILASMLISFPITPEDKATMRDAKKAKYHYGEPVKISIDTENKPSNFWHLFSIYPEKDTVKQK